MHLLQNICKHHLHILSRSARTVFLCHSFDIFRITAVKRRLWYFSKMFTHTHSALSYLIIRPHTAWRNFPSDFSHHSTSNATKSSLPNQRLSPFLWHNKVVFLATVSFWCFIQIIPHSILFWRGSLLLSESRGPIMPHVPRVMLGNIVINTCFK